jgi:single-strand DNA-binding protein
MPSLNKVELIGHVGKDPESRTIASGQLVAGLSVATSERGKDGVERTEWHRIVAWSKAAEACRDYIHKGDLIYVEGKIQTRKWKDKDGQDRTSFEIVAFRVLKLHGQPKPVDPAAAIDYSDDADEDGGPLPF